MYSKHRVYLEFAEYLHLVWKTILTEPRNGLLVASFRFGLSHFGNYFSICSNFFVPKILHTQIDFCGISETRAGVKLGPKAWSPNDVNIPTYTTALSKREGSVYHKVFMKKLKIEDRAGTKWQLYIQINNLYGLELRSENWI